MTTTPTVDELAVDLTSCPYCKARKTEWCKTTGGKPAATLHDDRTRPLFELETRARGEGAADALADIAHHVADTSIPSTPTSIRLHAERLAEIHRNRARRP